MAKSSKSVVEMVADVTGDKEFVEDLKKEIAEQSVATTLFVMRCASGLSQKEMAKRLGCSQGRISKLEHSKLNAIRVSDLLGYAVSLNLQLSIAFHRELNAVQSVKFHVFQAKNHLDKLADLAEGDEVIREGVSKFFTEALVNTVLLFNQSAQRLRKPKRKKRPVLEVLTPFESGEEKSLSQSREDLLLAIGG